VTEDDLAVALAAARGGDEVAFALIWRALQPPLLRYLRVLIGDAAEDAASETWLQAARDLGGFTGTGPAFRGWLFRIARNRAIDEGRRAARRPDPSDTAAEHLPPAVDAAADAVERSGTRWALRIIATLPPDQAEAVMLRVVAGLDVAATATVLGKRSGAVRIATMRGLRRLAAHPEVEARDGATGWLGDVTRPEGV
jgi:RNA polymerase sigma-70 factor (ECF subfamily)